MHFFLYLLAAISWSYIANWVCPPAPGSETETFTTSLSTAAQSFISTIAQDPLLSSEARVIELESIDLWNDYPFREYHYNDETLIKALYPGAFESSCYIL
ncbi:hypothetical protein BKA65DRAFT_499637 [Rhexocercosporidium sp. MPI-PUGE-AT-0058]|nr:hypothetical protein BKA65DRAFT_499637 [Rhexocercosporidium sp. MPI-PUGE-AT-0058]